MRTTEAMAAPTRTPRTSWIEEGLRSLGVGGPDAVRVESLAQALGVTKGGFYWHFTDRRALLDEMLDSWERVVTDDVIRLVDSGGGDARVKLRLLFSTAVSIDDMVKIEIAIREWARREEAVAERVKRVDNRRMAYMRSLFGAITSDEDDIEVRCLLAFALFIGNHFITADHEGRTRRELVTLATERLLI
jgi:AcrR family transcriptional regulator